jgi:hypothetical protein
MNIKIIEKNKIQEGKVIWQMSKNKLVSKMKLFGDRNEDLAVAIGISPQRFSAKLNGTGGAEFTMSEIMTIKIRYKLTAEEVNEIFFCE